MRIYIPSTIPLLDAACHAGEFGPAPQLAYAVTPALREWFASADDEELEYAAMAQAGACLGRAARGRPRRGQETGRSGVRRVGGPAGQR